MKGGIMPLSEEARIHLARYLLNIRVNADTDEGYDLVDLLTRATEKRGHRAYMQAVRKMVQLGWTSEEDLAAEAAKFELGA
jgi:hypothetical protein